MRIPYDNCHPHPHDNNDSLRRDKDQDPHHPPHPHHIPPELCHSPSFFIITASATDSLKSHLHRHHLHSFYAFLFHNYLYLLSSSKLSLSEVFCSTIEIWLLTSWSIFLCNRVGAGTSELDNHTQIRDFLNLWQNCMWRSFLRILTIFVRNYTDSTLMSISIRLKVFKVAFFFNLTKWPKKRKYSSLISKGLDVPQKTTGILDVTSHNLMIFIWECYLCNILILAKRQNTTKSVSFIWRPKLFKSLVSAGLNCELRLINLIK